jgi:uncharacterized protein (DUF169 family)
MDNAQLASRLSAALELDRAPVAMAMLDGPGEEFDLLRENVPSACSLWRLAAERCFYAPAETHYNCPVGAYTMGFQLPDRVRGELMDALGLMGSVSYFSESEVPGLPRVDGARAGIAYGPLERFPVPPDCVLVWMTPRSAMVFAEARGDERWDQQSASPVLGRPGCAAIPVAAASSAALSFGCAGMRTFTEIADSHLLGAIAGADLGGAVARLEQAQRSNAAMLDHYQSRASAFPT